MRKDVPVGLAVAVIALLVLVGAVVLFTRAGTGKATGGPGGQVSGDTVKKAQAALQRTHGDKSQMTADERAAFDEAVKKGRMMDPSMTAPPRPTGLQGSSQGLPPSDLRGPR